MAVLRNAAQKLATRDPSLDLPSPMKKRASTEAPTPSNLIRRDDLQNEVASVQRNCAVQQNRHFRSLVLVDIDLDQRVIAVNHGMHLSRFGKSASNELEGLISLQEFVGIECGEVNFIRGMDKI